MRNYTVKNSDLVKVFLGFGGYIGFVATMSGYISYKVEKVIEPKDDKYYIDIRKKQLEDFIKTEKKYKTEKEKTLESFELYENNEYIKVKRQEILRSIERYNGYIKEYETEKDELEKTFILKEPVPPVPPLMPLMPEEMGFRRLLYRYE